MADSEASAVDRLRSALEAGQRLAPGQLDDLDFADLIELATSVDRTFDQLVDQTDRSTAVELLSVRLQAFIMEGRSERALEQVSDRQLWHAATDMPELIHVILSALVGAAWFHAGKVAETLSELADSRPRARHDDHFALAAMVCEVAGAWRRLDDMERMPESLAAFVQCWSSVGYAFREQLVAALRADLAGDRGRILTAIDRMEQSDPRLPLLICRMTDGLIDGEDQSYDDLPEAEQRYIAEAMDALKSRLSLPSRGWLRLLFAAMVAGLIWLAVGGMGGIILAVAVLIVVGFHYALSHLGELMQASRSRIADAVVETGLGPDRMVEWAHRQVTTGAEPVHPFGFEAGFAEDRALQTLGRLARVCLRWQPPSLPE